MHDPSTWLANRATEGGVGLESKFKTGPALPKPGVTRSTKLPPFSQAQRKGVRSQWGRAPGLTGPKPLLRVPGQSRHQEGLQAGTLRQPPSTEPGEKQALGPAGPKASQASTLNNSHQAALFQIQSRPIFNRRKCTIFITDVHVRVS